jgi:hypothetical protein
VEFLGGELFADGAEVAVAGHLALVEDAGEDRQVFLIVGALIQPGQTLLQEPLLKYPNIMLIATIHQMVHQLQSILNDLQILILKNQTNQLIEPLRTLLPVLQMRIHLLNNLLHDCEAQGCDSLQILHCCEVFAEEALDGAGLGLL